ERSLHEPAEHLAPDLVAEHALDDGAWRLARPEATQPRLAADALESSIELGLHRLRRHLDPEPLADGGQVFDRHPGLVHPSTRASGTTRTCERGDSNPHGCPRDPKSRASASSATLAPVREP